MHDQGTVPRHAHATSAYQHCSLPFRGFHVGASPLPSSFLVVPASRHTVKRQPSMTLHEIILYYFYHTSLLSEDCRLKAPAGVHEAPSLLI